MKSVFVFYLDFLLFSNFLLKFESEKVVNGLGISSETCKMFLSEAVACESTSKAVQVVCSSVLLIMDGINGRNLN